MPGTPRSNGRPPTSGTRTPTKKHTVPFPRVEQPLAEPSPVNVHVTTPPPHRFASAPPHSYYKDSRSPTPDINDLNQPQLSDNTMLPAPKDKKKALFRFPKKKSRHDLHQQKHQQHSQQQQHERQDLQQRQQQQQQHHYLGGSVFPPRKRSYDMDPITGTHPFDLSMTATSDDAYRNQTVYYQQSPYTEQRKKSGGSTHSRKGKDRDNSLTSTVSGGRNDSGYKTYKDTDAIQVDQNFGNLEGIINPEYQGDYFPRQYHDSAEAWAPPDSWQVLPAESEDEASDYDNYSIIDGQKYETSRRNYCIRIFRPDGTFATLQLPLHTTAGEIVQKLASKFFIHDLSKLNVMLKKHKLERVLSPNERPLHIQKTLLEQMGYTEQDNIEDVGREDNSYLLRFIFGSNMAQVALEDADYSEKQHIDLQARNFPTIPIFLYKHAARIVSLDLSKNLQLEIPVDFLQMCRNLKQLWLANNEYTTIPSSVRCLFGLEHLNVSGNRLREIHPAILESIPRLKTLRAFDNRLDKLPSIFSSLKNLTMLFISNNEFTTFPQVVCELSALTYLDISFNKISTFPDEIGNLTQLVRLFAIANRFTGSLPPSFSKLVHLQELDIRQNALSDLDVLCTLPRLEILYVGYNAVSIASCVIPSLRQLKMTKNHLTQFHLTPCQPHTPLIHHGLSKIVGSPDTNATTLQLTSLDLSSCMLPSLSEDIFRTAINLEDLVLDNNKLTSLPSSLAVLRKLSKLSVQGNLLDTLPAEIGELGELKLLDVQKNNLKSLPKEIWLCPSLQTLNCSSNLLQSFPKPYSAPGVALHLPLAPEAESVVTPSVVANAAVASRDPSAAHAGQGTVPFDRHDTAHAPSNFNPPSFFASPRNHPPPLSLSLRALFLGDNRLGNEIWSPLMLFLELRTLNLSFNDLDEIPPEHLCHQHLYELYLSGNHLTSLPADDIEKLSYLRVLAVNGNKLQTLPAEIGKLRKLLVLDVGNNVLKYNISNWPYDWNWNWNLSLKYLNLSGNKRLEIKKTHPEVHGPKEKDLSDFSSLTRLQMLGLMDITILGVSIPEESPDRRVRTSPTEVNRMGYGIADWLGSEHIGTWDLVMPRFRNNDDECIFGLFDGARKSTRSGCKLTKYLNDNLTFHVMNELRKSKNEDLIVGALRRAFLSLEKSLGAQMEDTDAGASAVVCYINDKRLYVANVGDAMAILCRNSGQVYEITHKHIAINPPEISRIRASGGFVSNTGKLNNEFHVSRGFGYFEHTPTVNANPYIASIELAENDEFVIMASASLWQHMSYQTAVDVARTESGDAMAAAQKLRDFALTYGADKDLMVMVIGVGDLFDKRDKRLRHMRGIPGRPSAAGESTMDDALATSIISKRRVKDEGPADSTLARLDREVPPPINQVALVFTDIKSSTLLWETQPENMQSAIKIHDAIMRRTLRSVGGYEVKTEGDAFMVCFQNITSALLWCFTVQLQLLEADWPAGILETEEGREVEKDEQVIYRGLSVRMGVHWGTPVFERNPITNRMDYFGPVVNKASRICNAADGGQICVSSDVLAAMRDFPGVLEGSRTSKIPSADDLGYFVSRDIHQLKRLGFQVQELGFRRLKGLETPEMLSFVYPKQLAGRMEINQAEEPDALQPTPAADLDPTTTASTSQTVSPQIGPVEDVEQQQQRQQQQHPSLALFEQQQRQRAGSASAVTRTIDPNLVVALSRLAVRLECLTTNVGQAKQMEPGHTVMEELLERHILHEAADADLVGLMENFVARVENAVSSLYLKKMGHFANVLERLGDAIELDPDHILRALQMYSEVAGLTDTAPAGLADPGHS
ncbi:hypothetical protein BCR43DRAFT_528239 [Syncephalastrum racemosum]|uniref:Adenylate cyclase n=1 Tax=Syncephalastrum racemosum TaxID=13706 RepID=A0A1X2GZJ6_SYNRA|nr:hypothetical protein BCR43DRAFT_528239 [Syncephalastrum racemosum]